jgi:beta-ribofuranosylaminobenzene 5'-phosphate synthase
MKKEVSRVYNRVHINSINMSDQGILSSGGLGFSIKYAPMTVEVSYHEGQENNIVSGISSDRIISIITNLHETYNIPNIGWQINVEQVLKPHIGLGSTTQIEAQILTSCLRIAIGKEPGYQDYIFNGIGIESGIGLKCFIKPGFHIDFGYWRNVNKITKINSSEAVTESLYYRLPDEWKVLLIVPKEYTSVSGSIEQGFWDKILPAEVSEAYKISFYTLMGIIPAIMEKKFNVFIEALKIVATNGTKPLG